MSNVVDVGREAAYMLWATLWALVLGFTLSGLVQAFVSKDRMQRVMGDHRFGSVARASGFGMVSSSCSYAATAMAKSLFQKGADFTSAMAFMFASTNLVLELGVVLTVLLGWQFAAAEFIGGPIMIGLLALVGGFVFRGPLVDAARQRLRGGAGSHEHVHHEHSKPTVADAASYAIADVTMLRKELVIGYGVAAVLMVYVSPTAWNDLFFHGHGFWTSLENALVGPLIAFVSFVCSVGNVPMAATLFHGGMAFGGVIAFIFADLITLPLVLIYRKYYGTKLTLRLVGVFYVVMVVAGLIVEGIFELLGAVPDTGEAHGHHFGHAAPSWNYTTWLNIVFLVVFAGVYLLHRRRGTSDGFAIDPVCGMQVQTAHAPAQRRIDGVTYWFCADRCAERFDANTAKFTAPGAAPEGMEEAGPAAVSFTRRRPE